MRHSRKCIATNQVCSIHCCGVRRTSCGWRSESLARSFVLSRIILASKRRRPFTQSCRIRRVRKCSVGVDYLRRTYLQRTSGFTVVIPAAEASRRWMCRVCRVEDHTSPIRTKTVWPGVQVGGSHPCGMLDTVLQWLWKQRRGLRLLSISIFRFLIESRVTGIA